MNHIRIISWNCRGINNSLTRRKVRQISRSTQANILCLQETKCDNWTVFQKEAIWDSKLHEWITVNSQGLSGGLAISWDATMMMEISQYSDQNWIWFHGSLKSQPHEKFCCVNPYMPHKRKRRRQVWQNLNLLLDRFSSLPICIIGDFNCILSKQDRHNCQYRKSDTEELKEFLARAGLWDVPIHKGEYTWFGPGSKCSRLDRAIINHVWEEIGEWLLESQGKMSSDHAAILLSQGRMDWGYKPFKVYNAWLAKDDFLKMVTDHWGRMSESNLSLHGKQKSLRWTIKEWYRVNEKPSDVISRLENRRNTLLGKSDSEPELQATEEQLWELYREQEQILRQQAKLNWELHGDSKSKYFHRLVQYRRKQNHIRGILHDGIWYHRPDQIKNLFLEHFEGFFNREQPEINFDIQGLITKQLSADEALQLEREFTLEELFGALMSMDSNKSPGPDGISVEYLKKMWTSIHLDVLENGPGVLLSR